MEPEDGTVWSLRTGPEDRTIWSLRTGQYGA